jgi:L-threonylcarbamoyladenylate synthase
MKRGTLMIRRYKENEVEQLADILRNDGVISVPTDTVYGICARINSEKAYNKLMDVKKRPKNKAFPIMCADERQIKNIAVVDARAEKLIRAFMPGPITLVLNRNNTLSEYVTNGKDTIAVRMATSKVLEELIRKTESPLFMTSANKSEEPECTNLDDIEKACPLLDGMLDGNVVFGEASTIVDCSSEELKILRIGPISIEQIKKVINMK